jgi:hypothetical protein
MGALGAALYAEEKVRELKKQDKVRIIGIGFGCGRGILNVKWK